ncbi:flagellin [Hoeflea sp. IMCC20628]|uniref:flagellin N-terminal helical domain-containing protein n=1 Tax=Hoeflea sp. IMCC20628 TaxID=1620421 RepID=UPI00063AB998|nr:flagellin [Hoeflea sp. IMCC20628]
MSSIHTNHSAMSALATLRQINAQMETTMQRISTGLRVNDASDNAAYWSIATTLRSDMKAKSAVVDALGLSRAMTDVASAGMSQAVDIVGEIKAKLVLASEPGVDKTKINKELDELKAQLLNVAQSSSFNGQNWLYGSPGIVSMPASTRDYGGFVSVGYIEVDKSETTLIDPADNSNGILTEDRDVTTAGGSAETFYLLGSGTSGTAKQITLDANTTADELSGMVQAMDDMEKDLIDANAMLGIKAKGIERQEAFTKKLIEVSKKALGRLVDADMAEESTRLKALQVQQQLAIQALSIANSQPNMILQLFR